jgi:hypothetical protein
MLSLLQENWLALFMRALSMELPHQPLWLRRVLALALALALKLVLVQRVHLLHHWSHHQSSYHQQS